MGRWSADRQTVREALIVSEHGSASWDQYVRATSRADDQRDPAGRDNNDSNDSNDADITTPTGTRA